ncbi:putative pentatricopeptide repeat-containing protein At5g37570 [Arachis duranensis]|uniref:Pentatricopeptide repeat-containing protein At5g37570 n=1 Tax=Arachis duranensis TaxID=130453 RepID=A0A6P5MP79_ARADU|nr:putative pentatricopeptide repeat-containing protein At5g37570 [Arachis duranensis]
MNSIFQHSYSPLRSTATITTLLKPCKTIHHLYQVHASIIQRGLEQDHLIISHFIFLFASFATTASYYTAIFDRVLGPSPFLWNSLIGAHTKESYFFDAFSAFIRMKAHGSLPDRYTYSSVIKACLSMCRSCKGKLLHGSTLTCWIEGDMFVGTCLVDMYEKFEKIGDARKVFDRMSEKNVVSAMVVGYVKVGDMVEAKRLIDKMPQRNVASWNAMKWGFVKVGDLGNARVVLDAMSEKSIISFTIMIDGYAKAGDMATSRALRVFLEMESMNVKPDEFILFHIDMKHDHVIAALLDMNAKCGNMERALKLFEETPNRDRGHLRDAYELIKFIIAVYNHHYNSSIGLLTRSVIAYDRLKVISVKTYMGDKQESTPYQKLVIWQVCCWRLSHRRGSSPRRRKQHRVTAFKELL